jgi:hypothetical protein
MGGFALLLHAVAGLGRAIGMGTGSLAARLAVAVVLAVAGGYKLRHPLIAAVAAVNFRVVPRPWKAVGRLLGAAEVVVAAALITPVVAVAAVGALAAGVLGIGYVAVVGAALAADRRFPCNCLPGLVGDVSVATLARALAIIAGAALGLAGPLTGALGAPLPAAGLALAFLGLPLAGFGVVLAWGSYRAARRDTDWTWVLAARNGQVFVPPKQISERRG